MCAGTAQGTGSGSSFFFVAGIAGPDFLVCPRLSLGLLCFLLSFLTLMSSSLLTLVILFLSREAVHFHGWEVAFMFFPPFFSVLPRPNQFFMIKRGRWNTRTY